MPSVPTLSKFPTAPPKTGNRLVTLAIILLLVAMTGVAAYLLESGIELLGAKLR